MTATETEPELIDSRRLFKMLGVSEAHGFRLKAAGKLPQPVRLGKSVRWPLAEVRAWLAERGPTGELLTAKEWADRRRK